MLVPRAGAPNVGLEPFALRKDLQVCDILFLCGSLARSVGPDWIVSLPPPTHLDVFFLYILNCIRAILLVFRSFSEKVVLYVVVVLLCLWEEVSSGSSYSTILIPPHWDSNLSTKQCFLPPQISGTSDSREDGCLLWAAKVLEVMKCTQRENSNMRSWNGGGACCIIRKLSNSISPDTQHN